ncbi:DNA-binding domain-containing protein [Hymenobacter swuensis]|uniref:Integrase catalytic domain-containing protein n=1 Tax=Hymenobacter swuensis DY53 TaxID=1227739 RepID=W8EV16_9BACT|nr:helix-turn-helix domain-containing protein [Hymenobacter swuensis]AHJ95572.1 hypothetical protein Hsw_PA0239 [Hymenobacter swuensis DY53]
MADLFSIAAGVSCSYLGQSVMVRQIINLTHVVVEIESGRLTTVPLHLLQAASTHKSSQREQDTYQFATEQAQRTALSRYSIIQPYLQRRVPASTLAEVISQQHISESTFRRWLQAYRQSGLAGLLPKKPGGGKRKSRLQQQQDEVLQLAIEQYLSPQRPSVKYVYETLCLHCIKQQIPPPSLSTVRRRIAHLPSKVRIKGRQGKQAAQQQCDPVQSSTLEANQPLDVVEVDHALLNIVLLDEQTHRPVGRPWLTVALDVYSRMVIGFHLGLELPGAGGTGMCLSHAFLPKETWLAQRNITGEWPCWGIMRTLHFDNAKEFRGNMVRRACEQYEVAIQHRPPGEPHYGGHVERWIKTLKFRIRHLSGAYLSNRQARRTYRAHAHAVFTLPAFEKWLATYIVQVYHHRPHSSLLISPLQCYEQGLLAANGRGIPPRPTNERQVQLDFLPFVERTIQRYGVVIGHLHYYDGVLSPFIEGRSESGRSVERIKYVFRLDPRDISKVYFLDPATREYHTIPLLDMSQGQFSALTKREALRRVRLQDPTATHVRESHLFSALQELQDLEQQAQQQVAAQRGPHRKPISPRQRRLQQEAASRNPVSRSLQAEELPEALISTTVVSSDESSVSQLPRVRRPFPNLDDGTSHLLDS